MDLSVYWYGGQAPRVEPLRGTVKSEVVVVGGGMAGLTCARTLAARGVDVTLVEQAFCGAGASGKTSGFITPDSELELSDLVSNYGEREGQALWEFARSGLERVRRTIKELAIECDYQVQDSLFVARTARAFRKVIEAEHRTHDALGCPPCTRDARLARAHESRACCTATWASTSRPWRSSSSTSGPGSSA